MKRRDFERLLREHGCVPVRDKGEHTVWQNPSGDVVPVPRHSEIKKYTAREICKDLGIDPKRVPN